MSVHKTEWNNQDNCKQYAAHCGFIKGRACWSGGCRLVCENFDYSTDRQYFINIVVLIFNIVGFVLSLVSLILNCRQNKRKWRNFLVFSSGLCALMATIVFSLATWLYNDAYCLDRDFVISWSIIADILISVLCVLTTVVLHVYNVLCN